MADTSVKRLSSTFRGAPTLNGTVGTLIAVLDACLVNGFGQVSVTGISISGGVATATAGTGDSFELDSIVFIDGATPAGLNGEQRVKSTTSTSFTFDTSESDGAATGTITAKYAPLAGWEKTYSGTNKAVYRSIDANSPGHFLRVDDTGTSQATVRGYETMSDVDTGTGEFPLTAQAANSFWQKSYNTSATPIDWDVVGDNLIFYAGIQPGISYTVGSNATSLRGFGFPVPLSPLGDIYATVLSAQLGNGSNYFSIGAFGGWGSVAPGITTGAIASPRPYSGVGTSILSAGIPFVCTSVTSISGTDTMLGQLSGAVDGKLRLSSVFASTSGFNFGVPPRSIIPGVYHCPQQDVISAFSPGTVTLGTDDLAGRKLLALGAGVSIAGAPTGIFFIDITGPWR